MQKNIRDYQVFIDTDEKAARLKKVLDFNKEPISNYSALYRGKTYSPDVYSLASLCGKEWMYSRNAEKGEGTTIEEFEQLFGQKSTTTKVSRQALGEIYPKTCAFWRGKIDELLFTDQFSSEIEIPEDLIREAHQKAETVTHKEWLQKYLPLPEPKFKVGDYVVVLPEDKYYDRSEKGEARKVLKIRNNPNYLPYEIESTTTSGGKNQFTHVRLATKEEIERAQYYPDGTPCLVKEYSTTNWMLAYADGKGKFKHYKNAVNSTAYAQHQKLDINNLPG